MRKGGFIALLILSFIAETALCLYLYSGMKAVRQDVTAVNACLKEVEKHYGDEQYYLTDIDYTLIDNDGNVTFMTSDGLSKSLAEAVSNSDSVIDIECEGGIVLCLIDKFKS